MKRLHKQSGYTLVELLVYLVIFILISVAVIQSLVYSMKTYATAQAYRRLQSNGELIMERIVREIRDADAFGGTSVYDTTPGMLVLYGTDESSASYTRTFTLSGNQVQIIDSSGTNAIASNEVVINSLIFRKITTAAGEGVKIELTLTTANGYINSASFYDTAFLR
jgi:Tfp pilus assembly protein PilW